MRPLVSVITPTWQRHELLAECIESVAAQTYRPLEHIVVSDGEDEAAWRASKSVGAAGVPVQLVELGRNWSSFLPDSFCAAPMTVGMLIAGGTYQTWLADDERMEPDHIETLVDALEASGADFAYGRVRMHRVGHSPEQSWEIGSSRPSLGQITNVLYRTDLLRQGLYPFGAGMTSDWACIARWLSKGATSAFVDRVTLTHRVDH